MEHVAASLGHGGHLGDDGQVVDDERHLVLLVSGQVLRVAQQPEAGHVRGRVRVELVHQLGRCKTSRRKTKGRQNHELTNRFHK